MGFTPLEHEWIQTIIHMMSNILKLDTTITYTTSLEHFNRYHEVGVKTTKSDMGSADTVYGYIWINSKEHENKPVSELLNTIIHELLHIKYPDMSEDDIIKETDKYVPIRN
tara:strand:- start:664 stop:996 length:333 start_codon:yes stop_codon:yes gene_type:complete